MATSILHETLVQLFRDRPSLAFELLRDALAVPVPKDAEPRLAAAEVGDLAPAELRADVVLLANRLGVPLHAVIVEVQLQPDADKPWVWPAYLTNLRARHRCPVALLIVTPDERTARWAARSIPLGARNAIAPEVLGPGRIPLVSSAAEARERPELAVLSALARRTKEAALTAVEAASDLDPLRAELYIDLVLSRLDAIARAYVEGQMHLGKYEYQTEFVRNMARQREEAEARGAAAGREEGREEGREKGLAEAVLVLLSTRGVTVPEAASARILGVHDVARLQRWIGAAATASSVDEVLDTE